MPFFLFHKPFKEGATSTTISFSVQCKDPRQIEFLVSIKNVKANANKIWYDIKAVGRDSKERCDM